ncbi:MAG TPA: hypothetical protein VHU80_06950 [Polyangiaceae bacterium]|nr:hypothetical protein [Polyangiaceae bacterium]
MNAAEMGAADVRFWQSAPGGVRLQAIWELSVEDDLILSKHAAARPQDLVDAKHLERERALKKG